MISETVFRRRLTALIVAIGACALGVAVRLVDVQLLDAQAYRDRASKQHEDTVELDGQRGSITDRNGRELAVSIDVDSVFVHPWQLEDPETVARRLALALGIERATLAGRLASSRPFVWVKRRITPTERKRIEELGLEKSVHFKTESKRFYPKGALASHLLGFVGTDGIGLEGVEMEYDGTIRGAGESFLILRDAKGGAIHQRVAPEAPPGATLRLTIDEAIQFAAEESLERAMRRTRARRGTIVVADPRTGEVLALANRPTFDPNQFRTADRSSMKNIAIGHRYEPGSTFKLITAAAGLDRRRVRPTDWFDCGNGAIRVKSVRIRDHHPWRSLSFADVLANSSNVGMIRLGLRLGAPTLHEYALRFGFGRTTGIGLSGEAEGIVHPLDRWSDISVASVSIGQEILVTPIQMLRAVCAIANGGELVPIRLVGDFRHPDGTTVEPPLGPRGRILSAPAAATLTALMERVVDSGTGRPAAIPGYRVAGKTGTAQKIGRDGRYSKDAHVSSFVGFAPADDPRVAAIVMLDEPRGKYYGGEVAGPWFSKVVGFALERMRVAPDEPALPPADAALAGRSVVEGDSGDGDAPPWPPRLAPERRDPAVFAGRMPDLYGLSLREALRRLARDGYRGLPTGSGFVVAQDPPAGIPAGRGSACRLELSLDPPPILPATGSGQPVKVARR